MKNIANIYMYRVYKELYLDVHIIFARVTYLYRDNLNRDWRTEFHVVHTKHGKFMDVALSENYKPNL